jgi:hypothetical protein
MAKKVTELRQFMAGTILSPSSTDIPAEAAIHSLNLDPVTEMGKLKGIPNDTRIVSPGAVPLQEVRFNAAVTGGQVHTIKITYDGTSVTTSAIAFDTNNDLQTLVAA